MFSRLVFWVLPIRYPEADAPILTINTSKDVVSRRNVPFGGSENYILHFDPIFAKNANFRSIFDLTENFGSKRPWVWIRICPTPIIGKPPTGSSITPMKKNEQLRFWNLDDE